MIVGWMSVAEVFERNRYGVSRRSFFVPGTWCQARRGISARLAPSCNYGERPQSAARRTDVPGTLILKCLARALQQGVFG